MAAIDPNLSEIFDEAHAAEYDSVISEHTVTERADQALLAEFKRLVESFTDEDYRAMANLGSSFAEYEPFAEIGQAVAMALARFMQLKEVAKDRTKAIKRVADEDMVQNDVATIAMTKNIIEEYMMRYGALVAVMNADGGNSPVYAKFLSKGAKIGTPSIQRLVDALENNADKLDHVCAHFGDLVAGFADGLTEFTQGNIELLQHLVSIRHIANVNDPVVLPHARMLSRVLFHVMQHCMTTKSFALFIGKSDQSSEYDNTYWDWLLYKPDGHEQRIERPEEDEKKKEVAQVLARHGFSAGRVHALAGASNPRTVELANEILLTPKKEQPASGTATPRKIKKDEQEDVAEPPPPGYGAHLDPSDPAFENVKYDGQMIWTYLLRGPDKIHLGLSEYQSYSILVRRSTNHWKSVIANNGQGREYSGTMLNSVTCPDGLLSQDTVMQWLRAEYDRRKAKDAFIKQLTADCKKAAYAPTTTNDMSELIAFSNHFEHVRVELEQIGDDPERAGELVRNLYDMAKAIHLLPEGTPPVENLQDALQLIATHVSRIDAALEATEQHLIDNLSPIVFGTHTDDGPPPNHRTFAGRQLFDCARIGSATRSFPRVLSLWEVEDATHVVQKQAVDYVCAKSRMENKNKNAKAVTADLVTVANVAEQLKRTRQKSNAAVLNELAVIMQDLMERIRATGTRMARERRAERVEALTNDLARLHPDCDREQLTKLAAAGLTDNDADDVQSNPVSIEIHAQRTDGSMGQTVLQFVEPKSSKRDAEMVDMPDGSCGIPINAPMTWATVYEAAIRTTEGVLQQMTVADLEGTTLGEKAASLLRDHFDHFWVHLIHVHTETLRTDVLDNPVARTKRRKSTANRLKTLTPGATKKRNTGR